MKRAVGGMCLALVLTTGVARADQPAPDPVDELIIELDGQLAIALAQDCAAACEALESMARVTDQICELDPGPRCDDARDKTDRARQRVREACPNCGAAAEAEVGPLPRPTEIPRPEEQRDEDAPKAGGDSSAPAPPAPAAEDMGGSSCATCSVGRRDLDPHGSVLVMLLAALGWLRRSRRRESSA